MIVPETKHVFPNPVWILVKTLVVVKELIVKSITIQPHACASRAFKETLTIFALLWVVDMTTIVQQIRHVIIPAKSVFLFVRALMLVLKVLIVMQEIIKNIVPVDHHSREMVLCIVKNVS